jgi:transcriptional regulator with XRE-family HTH domain
MKKCEKLKKVFQTKLIELGAESNSSEFARKCGLNQQDVSRYLTLKALPNSDKLVQISTHFNVTTDWLLGLSDQRGPHGSAKPQTSAAVEASVEPKHHKPTCSPCPTCTAKDAVIADLSACLREVSKGTGFPVRAHSSTKAPAPF